MCVFVFFLHNKLLEWLKLINRVGYANYIKCYSWVTSIGASRVGEGAIFSSNGEMGTRVTCRTPKRTRHAVRTLGYSSFNQTSQTVTHDARFLNLKWNQREFKCFWIHCFRICILTFSTCWTLRHVSRRLVPFMERDPKILFWVLTCFPWQVIVTCQHFDSKVLGSASPRTGNWCQLLSFHLQSNVHD